MLATAPCERDRLIEQNLDYARRLAARMARRLPRSVDVEELESDAYLGLLKAAESFDPGRGVAFTTYASTRINGAMLDGLRERALGRRRQPRPVMLSLNDPVINDLGRQVTHLDCLVDVAAGAVGHADGQRQQAHRQERQGRGGCGCDGAGEAEPVGQVTGWGLAGTGVPHSGQRSGLARRS